MSQELLTKMRKINKLLQAVGTEDVEFSDICEVIGDTVKANVIVLRNDTVNNTNVARVLGKNSDNTISLTNDLGEIDADLSDQLASIMESKENVSLDKYLIGVENAYKYNACIIPVLAKNSRLGTFILYKDKAEDKFNIEDIMFAEYGATIVTVQILSYIKHEASAQERNLEIVRSAIKTLSYSERHAIDRIFEQLGGNEGVLVASKVADEVKITRSVIVNALRKFESAGVIESRSLGMKGTYIKVLNDALLPELLKAGF